MSLKNNMQIVLIGGDVAGRGSIRVSHPAATDLILGNPAESFLLFLPRFIDPTVLLWIISGIEPKFN